MSLFVYGEIFVDYMYVNNGTPTGYPKQLPKSFENVSNFHTLSEDILREYGWYPVRFVPNPNKTESSVVTGQTFVVEGNEVVQYEQVREKTQEELDIELQNQWDGVRSERTQLLYESDWTQLADVPMSDEKKLEWATYRQSLRDITNYESPDEVIWPEKPSMDDPTYRTMQSPIGDGVINE
jgi:hypothetical protein